VGMLGTSSCISGRIGLSITFSDLLGDLMGNASSCGPTCCGCNVGNDFAVVVGCIMHTGQFMKACNIKIETRCSIRRQYIIASALNVNVQNCSENLELHGSVHYKFTLAKNVTYLQYIYN